MQYKAGDVVIIKDTKNTRAYNHGASIGKTIVLTAFEAQYIEDQGVDGSFTLDNNQYGTNFRRDDLELVCPAFKVGDEVRVINASRGWGVVKKGQVGVVKEGIYPEALVLDVFGVTSSWFCRPSDIELRWQKEGKEKSLREEYDTFFPMPSFFSEEVLKVDHKKTFKEVKSMLSILAKKLLDGDVKALVEIGWLDSELEITERGTEAVLSLFVEQNKEELAKRARAELKTKESK